MATSLRSIPALSDPASSSGRPSASVAEGPTARYLQHLLERAVQTHASDIHIHPLRQGLSIRMRVDGLLTEEPAPPSLIAEALPIRIKAMAGIDIAEKRQPQDGYWMTSTGHSTTSQVELRVSTLPSTYGENIVMRVVQQSTALHTLDDLGFRQTSLHTLRQLLEQPQGLVLVTGPTGSGKSITLYALLRELHQTSRHILTIEDPIEQSIDGVTQVQVNERAGLTFQTALRAFLRQDPDVMLVGEIRDRETASMAIEAAMTGHLVLSTLHTNDASAALWRLEKLGVPREALGHSLVAVLAQRLVRTHCPACAGTGCITCQETGIKGRTGIFETLFLNRSLRELYAQGAGMDEWRMAVRAQGVCSLMDEAKQAVQSGRVPLAEVLREVPQD